MKSETQNQQHPHHHSNNNIRIHHHRLDREYSIIANHGVENEKLSWAAKGLLWYMISRQSTFEIHSWHLAKIYKGKTRGNGIEATRSMLDELKNEGYIVHHKFQDRQGRWAHTYDVYPLPIKDFQKMFPHRVKACMVESGMVKPNVLPITEQPITELPIKNPPLSSPPEKQRKSKPPKEVSLRSEEEDFLVYKILEETALSPKDKKRLSKDFTEPEVARAVGISKTQKVKKSLMSLLLNILRNPDNWNEDAAKTQLETHQQHIAHEYNESLRKSKKPVYEAIMKPGETVKRKYHPTQIAEHNDKFIKDNQMIIILDGNITKVSLNSLDFEKDIKDAIAQLR